MPAVGLFGFIFVRLVRPQDAPETNLIQIARSLRQITGDRLHIGRQHLVLEDRTRQTLAGLHITQDPF